VRVIPPLKCNNYFISEDSEKAKTFNQYFAKQMSISNNIADLPTLPPFSYITDERLGSVDVNEAGVVRCLRRVNIHTSYGPDGISVLTLYISRLQSYLIFHYSMVNIRLSGKFQTSVQFISKREIRETSLITDR
jgi:hypothetical protein